MISRVYPELSELRSQLFDGFKTRHNPESTNQRYDTCARVFDGRGCPLTNDIIQAHHFPPSSTTGEPGKAQQGKIAIVVFFADFLQKQGIHPGESALIDDNNSEMARDRTHCFGIEYRRIEPRIGLVPELKGIIASLYEEA